MAGEDAIGATDTYGFLALKYFDDSYSYYGMDESAHITYGSTTDSWTELTVTGTVPSGATKVQAVVEFMHCVGGSSCYTGGSVYFDGLSVE